ncbi:MAG: hypothetical protein KF816_17270 [Melioribacteraceae bacterium]|nr:hypothetical protein [Melioribacteraceae bacterium]
MKLTEVFFESIQIRNSLKLHHDISENPIDHKLKPVLPFWITDKIKLIIIGQDPTVKNVKSRERIKYTLNLDKEGSLKKYITVICIGLGISFENVYATNVFKYFYSKPPQETMGVLFAHLESNLVLLKKELVNYQQLPVITLGLPVFQLLAGVDKQVRDYWGYNVKTKRKDYAFRYCSKEQNKLERNFFPFPHQPSLRKVYYKENLDGYLNFMKEKM